MKTHVIPLVFVLIVIMASCKPDKRNPTNIGHAQVVSMNEAKRDLSEIQEEVRNGSIDSYNELRIVYLDYPPEDFLFWALLMANKYDHPPAYLDLFHTLVISSVGGIDSIDSMDDETYKMAAHYLDKACDKEVDGAKAIRSSLTKAN